MIRAADAMEKSSSSAMLFDDSNDAFCNDDLVDFSIDIGDLYAILDEEPPPPPPSQANLSVSSIIDLYAILDEEPPPPPPPSQANLSANVEGFQHGEVTPNQFDPKQKSHADLENPQWNLVALDPQQETQFGFHYESEGNPNDITSGGGAHASTNFNSNYVCPMAAQYSSNGFSLSCPNNNYSVNAFGGSSGSFLPGIFDQLQFQTNMQECGVQGRSINSAGLIPFPIAADNSLYFNSEKMDSGNPENKPSFQIEYEESKPNGKQFCSISKQQNGETGSSFVFPQKNCYFTGGMHSSVNLSSFPHSTIEDGNMYPLSRYLYKDSNAGVLDKVKPETNTFEASNVTCDGSNRCLTLPTDSNSNAEFGFPQIVSAQFQQGVPYNSEKLDGRDYQLFPSQNSCWISEVKLHAKEESPDSSLADASISDLDAPLSDELCTEYSHSDDTSWLSESCTDSSPITSSRTSTSDHVDRVAANASQCLVSGSDATSPTNAKPSFNDEREDQLLQPGNTQRDFLKGGSAPVQKNPSRSSISVEHDHDICILDDISDPVCPPRSSFRAKPHPMSQRPEFSHYHGIGGMRLRPDDERLTFRLALKDLSQPKSEVSLPDGVLAVPLLRHQRIALSWMVKKETVNLHCSGGILADDQGLGKTVSTIALILMERSPSTRPAAVKKEDEYEAMNLDDDDDDAEVSVMKQPCKSIPMMMHKPMKKENSSMVVKGRPAAGTLVVCPTSVLRQWAEELQTKVTSKANLSFLVYHGSNRTKDPNELAKYDVVLTTYAIVSMEVPKQPLVDKDDEEKGKHDAPSFSSGLLNSKKRKDPPTSSMKNRKGTSTVDGALLESAARPLGRVGWFRVVLDEAQSIKNYRTQVARACWGLRAKRRWCLSGTPIQNAVDDLYSYFRFLRYDPYAVYKSFCSTIKTPISRNPTNGYKKLQAVLKTIMLRRTKGTILDGKPIITLPPKTISLKKVEFSTEECAFYSTLEAESREQFMEYEDAGTVKQNYVNILLMLLRLRQACDHPLLVKGCDSNSNKRSSTEMAKKLSREKKIVLLSHLEISLAICTICNDPPEDAVVTICGHVFCNQCVCEHLTADENICPSPNCKVPLRASSVFSKSTLKSTLSNELADDCCSGSSCFEMGDEQKKFEDNWSSGSSKIKAAVEILCSLPRSQRSLEGYIEKSDGESSNSSVNTPNSVSMRSPMDSSGKEHTSLKSSPKREVSEKAIVFSQWTGMLDLLEVPLKASCIKYRRLDGTMSVAAREKAIKDFNTLPEVTVIIMSLKAASLGLNLVAANHVILLDLWWNPTTEDQAIDRAHRIGQTRPVTVSRLTVKGTVEDKILSLQEKKRVMVASAFGEDESGSRQSRLTVEDLRYLFMT